MEAHNAWMPIRPPPVRLSPVVRAIRDEVKRKDLTAYAIAQMTKLNVTTVSRALSGEVSPTINTVETVAKALGLVIEVRPES